MKKTVLLEDVDPWDRVIMSTSSAMRAAGAKEDAVTRTLEKLSGLSDSEKAKILQLFESPFPGVTRMFLRYGEVAPLMGVSLRTVERWAADGVFKTLKIGGGAFIPVSEIAKLWAREAA